MQEATEEMPDVSLELSKVVSYADFLREEIHKLPSDDLGQFRLSKEQVDAFGWMLGDIGSTAYLIDKALEQACNSPQTSDH